MFHALMRITRCGALLVLVSLPLTQARAAENSGLLFRVSADQGTTADVAHGVAEPNFVDKIQIKRDPVRGAYIEAADDQVLSWHAPQNIYSQRGTLSFYWRAREPFGPTPFPLFRVGYSDHTSWDMAWLRVDWNGKGFDAFVTDDNLARVRVSYSLSETPKPEQWLLLTFTWDETDGVALYIDGKEVARKQQVAALDAGLDQFGPHSRVISPHQVQSQYQFLRGGDIDEIRIYDHAFAAAEVAALASGSEPTSAVPSRQLSQTSWRNEWWYRYGWNKRETLPAYLADARTRIRKVEFTAVYDLKQLMTAGADGIAETTWPGVYNRSRLPGRHDYFELPDWNTYVEGGKSVTFVLPEESWNRIDFQGAAYGSLTYVAADGQEKSIGKRAPGQLRTVHSVGALQGGKLRFDNVAQETPIQELQAFNVTAGAEPDEQTLTYTVRANADPSSYPALDELSEYVRGRYVADERTTLTALPASAPTKVRAVPGSALPLIHVLIPADFRETRAGGPVNRFVYGWQGMDAGLDGIALDLPALDVKATHGALFLLNIKVADPLWPARVLMDVSVAVKPGEARTVFLDTRDRMMPPGKSLLLTIAGAGEGFDAAHLNGMNIRLKFKPRAKALPEHIADRLAQARDNLAFLVEEHTASRRLARYARLEAELVDLLRVDPQNQHGREMWFELNPEQEAPAVTMPEAPADVPRWAFLQVEDLKRVHQFIEWWIDHRQVPNGDFGGGISDDDDLTQQWPPLALLGVIPDKVTQSLNALVDAAYRNGMLVNGLGAIKTDELHSYEEAINAKSEAMYLEYGDPKVVERLMETARAYPRIAERGADGHTHIVSNLFSGTDVSRDGPWGWSYAYSYLILHPALLLGDYNADPAIRALVIVLADGHLAHGKRGDGGSLDLPESIHAGTGQARGTVRLNSRGNVALLQLLWAAYRWTGDDKYLQPLRTQAARGPLSALDQLNSDVIDLLGKRDTWGAALKAEADHGSRDPFTLYQAWRTSGDTSYLEKVYADEIETAERRMWMMTEAHWWSDRVELFSDTLQRSRLGGMALRRNQMVPGHRVSWRFAEPGAAEQVGILIAESTPKHFKVTAFNLSNQPIHAVMTGWDVVAGRWRVANTTAGSTEAERNIEFERTGSIELSFPARQPVSWELSLVEAHEPVSGRADLAIGTDDVRADAKAVLVTVHNLGMRDAGPATVTLEDSAGRALARATTPALTGSKNFQTMSAQVRLNGASSSSKGLKVRVSAAEGEREITLLNNLVSLP